MDFMKQAQKEIVRNVLFPYVMSRPTFADIPILQKCQRKAVILKCCRHWSDRRIYGLHVMCIIIWTIKEYAWRCKDWG